MEVSSTALDLAVVILNYNTRDLLRNCLHAVIANPLAPSWQVCVVDNASTDGSAAMVRAEFPQVQVIVSASNLGFSRGNNLGLRTFGFGEPGSDDASTGTTRVPRYALLLNPDTVVPPDAFARMIEFMDANPKSGVVGPRLVRPDGSLDKACRRSFPTPQVSFYRLMGLSRLFPQSPRFNQYNLDFLDEHTTAEVDAVVGAFMMVRREAMAEAGLLDEDFFMYGEDLDWAYRIKQKGWSVWYHPAITVLHIKEAASRRSGKARVEFYRAMNIFYRKHYAANTPFWLHGLIVGSIALLGGVDVVRWSARAATTERAG